MRFCTTCGKPVERRFCANCGAAALDESTTAKTETLPDPGEERTTVAVADSSAETIRLPLTDEGDADDVDDTAEPRSSKRRYLVIANVILAAILLGVLIGVLVVGLGGDGASTTIREHVTTSTPVPESTTDEAADISTETPPVDVERGGEGPGGGAVSASDPRAENDSDAIDRAMATVGGANGDPVNIVLATGVTPPEMPTELKGWKPIGPVGTTEVRVFEGEPFAYSLDIGPSTNRCGDAMWTVRWRVANPDVLVRTGLAFTALLANGDQSDVQLDPQLGGAGFMSDFICKTPVFAWGSSAGQGNLVDVIVEYQQWGQAV